MKRENKITKKIKEGFVGQQMVVLSPNIKAQVTKNALIKGIYLTAIGFYPNAVYHDRIRKTGAPQYILLYCVNGEGKITVEDKDYHLYANSYFIIPRDVPHHYASSISNPWSIYWIHFTGDNADFLYSRFAENPAKLEVAAIPYDEERTKLFSLIIAMLENNYGNRNIELINIKVLELLASFIYYSEQTSFYSSDLISKSILFMNEHINQSFSIDYLAAQLNYSVSHYSNLFKKKTGFSPIHYFNQLKVQKACQYLYFTDMSIKEICFKIGIDDPYYFSRLFKKIMGISPINYRKEHKK